MFDSPVGVAVHGERVCVTDSGNAGKVRVFDRAGEFIADWDGFESPAGIATDHDASSTSATPSTRSRSSARTANSSPESAASAPGDGESNSTPPGPTGLDDTGNVYIGDPGQRVQVFAPADVIHDLDRYAASDHSRRISLFRRRKTGAGIPQRPGVTAKNGHEYLK
ncbi:MAG: hypothetical protein R2849_05005 [Thermomicrobiales bacterium]